MNKATLLAIDDDDMILSYLRNMLSDKYTVFTCSDPVAAIELAEIEMPDLILCDIDMPKMDGGAVSAALAENAITANIPLIYLTSIVSPSEVNALDGMVGGKVGVAKGAPLPELIAAIEAQLQTTR